MANVKITDLTELAAVDLATNDVLPIVDINNDSTKKVTLASLDTRFAANDFATFTQLNANINVVQDNVAALSIDLTVGADSGDDDTVTVGTDTLRLVGGTGLESTVSDNQVQFDISDTAVTAGLYGGVVGTETQVPVITVDAQGRITAASNAAVSVDLATLEGNVNLVQDNVTALTSNVDIVQDNVVQNTANISVVQDNVTANFNQLDANINVVQDNVTANFNQLDANISVVQDNVTANFNQLDANISVVQDNVTANFNQLDANIDVVSSNSAAVESRRVANIAGAISTVLTSDLTADRAMVTDSSGKIAVDTQVTATELNFLNGVTSALQPQISGVSSDLSLVLTNLTHFAAQSNANVDIVQDNVAAISDGTTPFTAPITFNDNVTVSGSLIVTGSQVDLGVSSAQIDDNFIELSANLAPDTDPATDSGLFINRGSKGNIFIGADLTDHSVSFAKTFSPVTNTTVAIAEYFDLHANAFHVEIDADLNRVHYGRADSEDTGIIMDDTGANINFVADGAYVANVHYDGTFNSQNAVISPAIFSNGVELQANDSATLFSAYANDYATYTLIDANVNTVQDNVAAVESRRTANIAGAISTVVTSDLTASRALESDSSGKISASAVTTTELGYVNVTELGLVEASKALVANTDGEITFPDDKKLYFGNDQDYSIDFTSGGDVFHRGPSTGEFRINTNQFQVYNAAETHVLFRADAGSITNLYYNGTLVFQVGSSNILVQGGSDFAVENNVQFGTNTSNTVEVAGEIDTNSIDTTTLKLGGSTVTSTAAELNYNDGVTLGTSQASKVVTADSDGDVTLAADVTINGNVSIGTNDSNTISMTGTLDLGVLT